MPLETLYIVRHGFRTSWTVDPVTGTYSSSVPSPTGIAVDPALTAHGVDQAKELGHLLMTLDPPVEAVYSSPYYRCLQTISPFVELQQQKQEEQQQQQQQEQEEQGCKSSHDGNNEPAIVVGGVNTRDTTTAAAATIRPEYGLCEWFGSAPFEQPQPASPRVLKSMFPAWDEAYVSTRHPTTRGETLAQLQQRLATTMRSIIDRCDAEDRRAVVLCTHAAVVIMLGRVLTGDFPDSVDADDFRAFTCGLSVYRRKGLAGSAGSAADGSEEGKGNRDGAAVADAAADAGVVGGWTCTANSDCSFLSCGEERGWKFSGDEEFPGTGSMSQAAAVAAVAAEHKL